MFFLFSKSKLLSVCWQKKILSLKRNIVWHKEPEPDPFVIIRARKEDYCEVINLLWKCYYPDEPTYAALKLGYKYHPIFDELAYHCLEDGVSFLAKCSFTYEVVGGCLNKICCPWDPDDLDKLACKLSSPNVRHLYQFRAYVQRTPCLWQNYCTDRVFELKNLFVRRQDRRRGVAKLLIQASRKLGADSGQRIVRLDATNMFMYVIYYFLPYQGCFILSQKK